MSEAKEFWFRVGGTRLGYCGCIGLPRVFRFRISGNVI